MLQSKQIVAHPRLRDMLFEIVFLGGRAESPGTRLYPPPRYPTGTFSHSLRFRREVSMKASPRPWLSCEVSENLI